jgi:hypothetical protein
MIMSNCPFPLEPEENELVPIGEYTDEDILVFIDNKGYLDGSVQYDMHSDQVFLEIENPELNCKVYFS